MSGWTPAFNTIYTGTLYGKWPGAPVWASLLPLIDKDGRIEMTFEAISGMTGWPMDLLRLGIAQLCQADPGSRSRAADGARLTLLDPDRPWGWRAVNHALYRERARLQAKNNREVETGKNARRLNDRRRPPTTAANSRGPAVTPSPNSDTNSNADPSQEGARGAPLVLHESLPSEEWEQWVSLRRRKRWPLDSVTLGKQLQILAEFDTPTQRKMLDNSIQSSWQGVFPLKGGAKTNGHPEDTGWRPTKGDPKYDPEARKRP